MNGQKQPEGFEMEESIQVAGLVVGHLRDELTDAEKILLEKWLSASEANKALFDELVSKAFHQAELPFFFDIDTDKAWSRLAAANDDTGLLVSYEAAAAKRRLEMKPLLTGDDLVRLGLNPGRKFTEILRTIEDLALEGSLSTSEEALNYVLTHFVT